MDKPDPKDRAPSDNDLLNLTGKNHPLNIILISIISALFVLVWFVTYEYLDRLVWENAFITANRWMFPILAVLFSLVVGVAVKYLKAPNCLEGSLLDTLSGGGGNVNWKILPAIVLTSIISLLSGAVVGPEGATGHLAVNIAGWFNEKFKVPHEQWLDNIHASLASAYNGLIENPIFTAVLSNDVAASTKAPKPNLPVNLVAGVIGYFIFFLIGSKGFENFLDLQAMQDFKIIYMFYIIIFALVGLALAVYIAIVFKVMGNVFSRLNDRILTRSLIGGLILGITGYFFPIVMFSGEKQIFTLISNSAEYGVLILLAIAIVKIILLGISFKTGFLGGPLFPVIFCSTAISLLINILFPYIPLTLIIAGTLTGALIMLMKTPFMVILLVAFFLSANTNLIALIILAAAIVMIIGPKVETVIKKR